MSDRFEPISVSGPKEAPESPAKVPRQASLPNIKLPKINLQAAAPWLVIAGLVVFIIWDRKGSDPNPDILEEVRPVVRKFDDTLKSGLASAHRGLAEFCEGRNPDPSEILQESKKLVSEALRASGAVFGPLDNKYLRDGTPSERVEYLEAVEQALEELR